MSMVLLVDWRSASGLAPVAPRLVGCQPLALTPLVHSFSRLPIGRPNTSLSFPIFRLLTLPFPNLAQWFI